MKIEIGDKVKFKSRKWVVAAKLSEQRLHLVLAPGEKPIPGPGIKEYSAVCTNLKNIKPIEGNEPIQNKQRRLR